MSTRSGEDNLQLVESIDDLVAWVAAGAKPRDAWRLGTEHEKIVFDLRTKGPVPYRGARGIEALMAAMMDCCGWAPVFEDGNMIALKRAPGEAGDNISLEPGGQFELSGAPLATVHETFRETTAHIEEVKRIGEELDLGFLGLGFVPNWTREEIPQMPKARYGVMTKYMPTVGSRGLDMMYRTATIQTNLDFGSERDFVDKMRASLAVQPIATALFAASPFTEGRLNGFKSMRSEVWRDTDTSRTGMLPFVFDDAMSYEAYVDYALDVPMYFINRAGRYIDVTGASFRAFMAGRLPGFEGELPTMSDWSDHMTTLFPEVRAKTFLEMRGADCGRPDMIYGLTAFWTGLLYDAQALAAVLDLTADWTQAERQQLRDDVPEHAFSTPFRDTDVGALTDAVLTLAEDGLKRRALVDDIGDDEAVYLAPLRDMVDRRETQADGYIRLFKTEWGGSTDPVLEAAAF